MAQTSLDQLLGFLLSDVSRLMRTRFDARARGLGLTRPQWRVLVFLARSEGINQSGLADLIEVERMTMGRMRGGVVRFLVVSAAHQSRT